MAKSPIMRSMLFCLLRMAIAAFGAVVSIDYAAEDGILFNWERYKQFHGKVYESVEHDKQRERIYLENSEKIVTHNRLFRHGLSSYRMAMNHFGDLDPTEFLNTMTGLRDPVNVTDTETAAVFMPSPYLQAPDQLDWRKSGYVTPVKNQGRCGSCWAFSVTGALEGQNFKKTKKLVSLSEQNLVDCSYKNHACDGGWMTTAFEYIRDNGGIDRTDSYPYVSGSTGKAGPCKFRKDSIGATDKGFVSIGPARNENALKKAVAAIGPISVAIFASGKLMSYKSGIFDDASCTQTINHAVLIVGYGQENGKDYWLVKNSWGTKWGENGYIKMARNKGNQCSIASYASYPLV